MPRSIEQQLLASWPRLAAYARSLTHENESARDLLQQSALKALSAKFQPSEDKATLAFLFRIIRNGWIDQTRRLARARSDAVALAQDTDAWTYDDQLINSMTVRRALASLDKPARDVVTLVDVEGFSYREAADALGVPAGTVMSRLHRARLQMLDLIGGQR